VCLCVCVQCSTLQDVATHCFQVAEPYILSKKDLHSVKRARHSVLWSNAGLRINKLLHTADTVTHCTHCPTFCQKSPTLKTAMGINKLLRTADTAACCDTLQHIMLLSPYVLSTEPNSLPFNWMQRCLSIHCYALQNAAIHWNTLPASC